MLFMKNPLQFLAALALLAIASLSTSAATKTWNGSASGLWSAAANWTPAGAPANGDALVFPAGPTRLRTTNAPGGATNLHSMTFSGSNYFVFGPTLSVTNGITNSTINNITNTIRSRVVARASQTWSLPGRNQLLVGSLAFTNVTLTADVASALVFDSPIEGGAGSVFNKDGNGRMEILTAANLTSLNVRNGELQVDGSVSGSLSVSNGAVLSGNGTVPAFTCAGSVRPGEGSVPGRLFVPSGSAVFQTGSTLQLNLQASTAGGGSDLLQAVNPPDVRGATLNLLISGTPGLGESWTIITNTSVIIFSPANFFAGLPDGATHTVNGIKYQIDYTAGAGGRSVTLTVVETPPLVRVWSGAGVNNTWTEPANWVGGIAPVAGATLVFPPGAARLTNINLFPPGTTFSNIIIGAAGCRIVGNWVRLQGGVEATNAAGVSEVLLPMVPDRPQSFLSRNAGATLDLHEAGVSGLTNSGHTLAFGGAGNLVLGRMAGSGVLAKTGAGQMTLTDNNGLYFGTLSLEAGKLLLDGQNNFLTVELNGGRLQGAGLVGGIINGTGGTLAPRHPGSISVQTIDLGATTVVDFQLNGPAVNTGFAQLIGTTAVGLGGASLNVNLGFTPTNGHRFTIVQTAGTSLSGTFAGLPGGSLIPTGTNSLRIDYLASGDVTLTVTNVFTPSTVSVWDANEGTPNTAWSVPANWVGNTVPLAGNDLVFPTPISLDNVITNDLAPGFLVNRLFLGGGFWEIYGNGIRLQNGLVATNQDNDPNPFLRLPVELTADQTWHVASMNLALQSSLDLGTHRLTVTNVFDESRPGSLSVANVTGTTGGITVRNGSGSSLSMVGTNTFTGGVLIESGRAGMGGFQSSGPSWQLLGGQLNLSGTIPGLNATGGVFSIGANTGRVLGGLNLSSNVVVEARVQNTTNSLHVAGAVNLASAELNLAVVSLGALNTPVVLLARGSPGPITGRFSGLPEGAFLPTSTPGVVLQISYTGGDGNDVTVTPRVPPPTLLTRLWDGGGADALWSTAANWLGDVPLAFGDNVVFPAGAARTTNRHNGVFVVHTLTFGGAGFDVGPEAGGDLVAITGGVQATNATGTNVLRGVALSTNQPWTVTAPDATLRVEGSFGSPTAVSGNGILHKHGAGTLEVGEGSSVGVEVEVHQGRLRLLSGAGVDEPVRVHAGELEATEASVVTLVATGGAIRAASMGTSAGLGVSDGNLAQGVVLTLVPRTGEPAMSVDLGPFNFNGATLVLELPSGLVPGQEIPLVNGSSTEGNRTNMFIGTFANLSVGGSITVAGRPYTLVDSYPGTSDKLWSLRAGVIPPVFTNLVRQVNGHVLLQGTGDPTRQVAFEVTTDFVNYLLIGNAPVTPAGTWTFTDTLAPGELTRFYRARAQ